MARPAELIAVAVRNLEREVPALGPLKLVVRLELRQSKLRKFAPPPRRLAEYG